MNLEKQNKYIKNFYATRCAPVILSFDLQTAGKCQKFLSKQCLPLLNTKGYDYTDGGDDAHRNFKTAGAKLGVHMLEIWAVYFFKHMDSIISAMEGNELQSESMEGRVADAVNYLLILAAIVSQLTDTQESRKDFESAIAGVIVRLLLIANGHVLQGFLPEIKIGSDVIFKLISEVNH